VIWYAAYASNLLARRFLLYLTGGVLAENGRDHAGARDPSPPAEVVPLLLPGQVYFATESATWGGGRALFDPDEPGSVALGRGYLITEEQFLDVVAQEMRIDPVVFNGKRVPVRLGERTVIGPGHYETLACVDQLDGYPVVTMAAPWKMRDVPLLAPSAAYRAMIAEGLAETYTHAVDLVRGYLDSLPGSG
jgi:hypothetical protein